jgi:hypothetical protein
LPAATQALKSASAPAAVVAASMPIRICVPVMRAGRPLLSLMPTSVVLDGMEKLPPFFWSRKPVYSSNTVLWCASEVDVADDADDLGLVLRLAQRPAAAPC